ncbi:hypothetical protein [Streptomyces sp. FL07-04A]|uniref:hypothetical protein n=1 Tax=Streptomyces sp. FL07-04A TaxID=3028658 RepID=UPI0029A25B69|nr:hypothetical protein [Streptomyces sp. FL07-04A]MDX3575933.1 hypothetical protein [Streptomyces sp. FL07-04A]
MASNPTPQRVIRVDDETWSAYGQLCEEKGVARSADLRMYIKREVAEWRKKQTLDRRLKHLGEQPGDDIL